MLKSGMKNEAVVKAAEELCEKDLIRLSKLRKKGLPEDLINSILKNSKNFGNYSDEALLLIKSSTKSFDDVLKLIDDYGDDFISAYEKDGDDAVEKLLSIGIEGEGDVAQAMLKTQSANAWGTLADGTNQGIKHFSNYWDAYPERIPSIANRLGVNPADFSNTVSGFENFTKAAQNVIDNPTQMRVVNGKSLYFAEGAENVNKGVTVIVQDGKIQSMMPTALKDFLKLK